MNLSTVDIIALLLFITFIILYKSGFIIKYKNLRVHHSAVGLALILVGWVFSSWIMILVGLLIVMHHLITEGCL